MLHDLHNMALFKFKQGASFEKFKLTPFYKGYEDALYCEWFGSGYAMFNILDQNKHYSAEFKVTISDMDIIEMFNIPSATEAYNKLYNS
jgi:hypothetical protein